MPPTAAASPNRRLSFAWLRSTSSLAHSSFAILRFHAFRPPTPYKAAFAKDRTTCTALTSLPSTTVALALRIRYLPNGDKSCADPVALPPRPGLSHVDWVVHFFVATTQQNLFTSFVAPNRAIHNSLTILASPFWQQRWGLLFHLKALKTSMSQDDEARTSTPAFIEPKKLCA